MAFLKKLIWQNLALIGLGLLMLVPLAALALHNHASPVDDYCYIDTVFKYGWTEAMKYYYTGWYGRYFAIFLNHSNPLIFHWFVGFKILPFIFYFGLIYSVFLLIRSLNPKKDFWGNMGLTAAVFYLLILKLPSIVEAFFWMAAVVNYTVANILTILWIVLMIRRSKYTERASLFGSGILSAFLVLLINGCSENNIFVILILIAAWLGYKLIFQQKLDGFYLFLLIWGIGTALLSFLAPGNAVRLAGNPTSKDLTFAIISSLKYTPGLIFRWIFNPSLLIFTVLWIAMLPRFIKRESGRTNTYFTVNPFYSLLVSAALVISQIFPSYYGIGIEPTVRVTNCIYFFFLLAWFFNIAVIFTYLYKKRYFSLDNVPSLPLGAKIGALALICLNFYFSENPRTMYREWLSGEAAAYDKEMTERTNLLLTSEEKTLEVEPLRHKPSMLYIEDLSTNPEHLWNRCTAGYFGKKVVITKEDSAK